jgi:hypothetical protein
VELLKTALQIGEKTRVFLKFIFSVYYNFLGYMPFEVDLTSLSGKLKEHRHINGLSQKQLGKILGVDGATVCSWEIRRKPTT